MTNDSRTPEEIEREIERERAGLTNTLDDLQDKFSVETIARQFSDQFREHGGDIGRSVTDAVKRNPIALALTGAGLAWLMAGDRAPGRDRMGTRDSYDHRDPRNRTNYYGDRDDHSGLPVAAQQHGVIPAGQRRDLGPQPGDPSKPYYSGEVARSGDVPSWARHDDDDDTPGLAQRAGDAASRAGGRVSGAASSAGSTVAGKAKGAAGAVSDAGHSVASGARDFTSSTADRAAQLRRRLAEGTEDLSEAARERVIAARESAVRARASAASYGREGRDRAVDIFEDQPLVVGALALAVGAAIGAALPRSRTEDRYMGQHRDQLMADAERIFAEEKSKLGKVAQAASDEAKKVLRETKEDADAAAPGSSAADAFVEKAKASGQRVVDAAEAEADKQKVGDIKKS
ncbi:MAG: DUF3618 domain-containing protein [Sulfitobacter litoralis]|jgi:hypothetical protein|uniref:DUF3618 domain-containing protein n=2 Tax=root TaxID=1 RepID=A0A1H0THL2_9RHOB|nr:MULTISPECIES: DUF3618 domain-containing protein [Sulfitobacter]MBQ0716533.1 DUF3618 domain-containing protein [Sulfitobacter litoralis]MBQ0765159.1 DUF3618 domain-containing protein [Sulfitobacter litoralis]MBQ0801246.1 DUF3618 domain-containing protein [Sulfitobacter litoralis]MCF7726262.1 DUF3618 domain-containing protein [Sulfitobacter sp. M22]MCF7777620.1 DUF3618 domain-containing protein [Sulfitobacter sp. M220]|tara:strand:+ start:2297 stop:3502 length:1206 start_codon:yes stop_codon:yes gene_type:complete